ncbi:uncharacterized protein EDB91DRAFT_1096801 [Suillus paluster]|uniref:uncharacterized protein n=1 Tax=Suillus paluster TaxID=48578 RepID=UPI001B881580|nr:uncharacterized protein EDB91DRAFT_1096801 [Suillus paluster]KAG1755017.1 hypothetical protein EDB91DRAFT_1096801 [Suillus paluster]
MNSSPPYPTSDYSRLPYHSAEADYRRLIMSSSQILEQVPPPSLREILGAYKSKGDGDRDMLIAMLNAKSAEDQRLASVASLHRTLLEMSAADAQHASPSHPSHSLPPPALYSKHGLYPSDMSNGRVSPQPLPVVREPPQLSQPPRKRQRSSHSPSSHYESRTSHTSSRDLPPSPYSSRSDSEEYSPRSRASMAIGSLLSTGPSRDTVPEDLQNHSETTHHTSSGSVGVAL